eukprot:779327-Amphidinium_carterae.3
MHPIREKCLQTSRGAGAVMFWFTCLRVVQAFLQLNSSATMCTHMILRDAPASGRQLALEDCPSMWHVHESLRHTAEERHNMLS